jgi:multiple sugar transport system substrate-binding protein
VSAPDRLRVALVGGPMYDHLYARLDRDAVEIVVHADHPTLNRRVAELLAAGERIDVLATHSKYAPSQAAWLRPLDGLLEPGAIAPLAPLAVDLCRFDGALLSVPRLVDVRVLWSRVDRVDPVPDSWAELLASDVRFGFPGRESGLFGTFFELVVGAGGALFDGDVRPTMQTPEAEWAVATLVRLAERAPSELPDWHYDGVDAALLDGRLDSAAAWPGGWGAIRSSPVAEHLRPSLYPTGSVRRVSYSGCHSWAIPTTCGDVDRAVALVTDLVGADAQALDASGGNLAAHREALAAVEPDGPVDAQRLAITRATIDTAMITYPPLARFPEVEDAGWSAIHDAIVGRCTPAEATAAMQRAAVTVLE